MTPLFATSMVTVVDAESAIEKIDTWVKEAKEQEVNEACTYFVSRHKYDQIFEHGFESYRQERNLIDLEVCELDAGDPFDGFRLSLDEQSITIKSLRGFQTGNMVDNEQVAHAEKLPQVG